MFLYKLLSYIGLDANAKPDKKKKLPEDELLEQVLESLPYATAILDEDRRVHLANHVRTDEGNHIGVEEFFGRNRGEPLSCLHATRNGISCDTNGICKFCGLPSAIIQSQITGEVAHQETTVSLKGDKAWGTYDIQLTARPFAIHQKTYTLLTIIDVSESKRKKVLERLFFHDILNRTGSLSGIIHHLREGVEDHQRQELLDISGELLDDLNEEIVLQKQLLAAESGELVIHPREVAAEDLLTSSVHQISKLNKADRILLQSDLSRQRTSISTDPVLAKRILINMLKNALEATTSGQKVRAGIDHQPGCVRYWVYNEGFIPESIRLQLFDRNFSTKGNDRGLGTYSMKMLGENYLAGRVTFSSNRDGTTFFFELPRHLPTD